MKELVEREALKGEMFDRSILVGRGDESSEDAGIEDTFSMCSEGGEGGGDFEVEDSVAVDPARNNDGGDVDKPFEPS